LFYSSHLTDRSMRGPRHTSLGSSFEFPEAQVQQASLAPDNAVEMCFLPMRSEMVA